MQAPCPASVLPHARYHRVLNTLACCAHPTQEVLWLLEDCPLQAFLPLHAVVVLSHMGAHLCAGGLVELTGFLLSYAGLGKRTAWRVGS